MSTEDFVTPPPVVPHNEVAQVVSNAIGNYVLVLEQSIVELRGIRGELADRDAAPATNELRRLHKVAVAQRDGAASLAETIAAALTMAPATAE